ncbi:MAG: S10 family peptidase [Acidimicrobiales bacterium]
MTESMAATDSTPTSERLAEDYDISETTTVTTQHNGTFRGTELEYTARAGRRALIDDEGEVEVQLFYVEYTRDGFAPADRPITFFINGGPGAATAWLHIGGLGPHKIAMNSDGSTPAPPARVINNPESPLNLTDMVFIDAPGTGYSRMASDDVKDRLLSFEPDLDVFVRFIVSYLTDRDRHGSPLFVYGESYGGLRAAGLSDRLVRGGIPVSGVVLLSGLIDALTITPSMMNNLPYELLVPSYATIAGFHGRLAADLPEGQELRDAAERWAIKRFRPALAMGNRLEGDERSAIRSELSRFVGVSEEILERKDLRLDVPTFMESLLPDRNLSGRIDARLIGFPPADMVEEPFYDPAMGSMVAAFNSAVHQYLPGVLGFNLDIPYRVYSRDTASRFYATVSDITGIQTGTSLQSALVKNPHFRVLNIMGIYDLATPYWSSEYALQHLPIPADRRDNITCVRVPAGHMPYADQAGLTATNGAFANFLEATTADQHLLPGIGATPANQIDDSREISIDSTEM